MRIFAASLYLSSPQVRLRPITIWCYGVGGRTFPTRSPSTIQAAACRRTRRPGPDYAPTGFGPELGFDGDLVNLEIASAMAGGHGRTIDKGRSEEHTSELQSLMRISYAVFCLKKKTQ